MLVNNGVEAKLIVGVVGGGLASLVGGWDTLLKCLLFLMMLDIVAGVVSSAIFHYSKYSNGGISSNALMQGAFRKAFMLALVALGVILDKVLEMDYIRNAVCMYFIATEGISLLEHLVHMGIPVPVFITKILDTIKEQTEGTDNEA